MNSLNQIYFSPTGTTARIVKAIGSQLGRPGIYNNDITFQSLKRQFDETDLVLIGIPVYAGRVPDIVFGRLEALRGNNTPAVVVAVYGNREYEDALLEIADVMTEKGFRVISGAAFIGEHSFSSDSCPLAVGRPDDRDLAEAARYGKELSEITDETFSLSGTPEIPGNHPYRERSFSTGISPETGDSCRMCLKCIAVCPAGAIEKGNPRLTDAGLCIKCCACIKACEYGARTYEDERIRAIAKRLFDNCSERKEPALFYPVLQGGGVRGPSQS